MLENIKLKDKNVSVTVNQTIQQTNRATAQQKMQAVNVILIVAATLLFIGILSTYFVEELPYAALKFRELSQQALWVFVGGYAIGEIFKILTINRGRASMEYQKTKTETEAEMKKINAPGLMEHIEEYCEEYSETCFRNARKLILENGNIALEEYEKKYVALSVGEIRARYPDNKLSKKQFRAIKQANVVKKEWYDPEFLRSTIYGGQQVVPSKRFNPKGRNLKNMLSSVVSGLLFSVFGVSFADNLIFHFSKAVVIAAIVKIITLVFIVSLKVIFANSLVFDTELGRLHLQKEEAVAYAAWYEKKKADV